MLNLFIQIIYVNGLVWWSFHILKVSISIWKMYTKLYINKRQSKLLFFESENNIPHLRGFWKSSVVQAKEADQITSRALGLIISTISKWLKMDIWRCYVFFFVGEAATLKWTHEEVAAFGSQYTSMKKGFCTVRDLCLPAKGRKQTQEKMLFKSAWKVLIHRVVFKSRRSSKKKRPMKLSPEGRFPLSGRSKRPKRSIVFETKGACGRCNVRRSISTEASAFLHLHITT